ncbi:MAG: hypothetical protein OEW30_20255, partial [Acidimicrobiia bacterium]|nr:hypothetical protein [Acidimicrobiia bacterium]
VPSRGPPRKWSTGDPGDLGLYERARTPGGQLQPEHVPIIDAQGREIPAHELCRMTAPTASVAPTRHIP